MRVHQARAFLLVEHGTRDRPARRLVGEALDAGGDLRAHVRRQRGEALLEQRPLRAHELRYVGEAPAARVAAATAGPPRMRLARGARAALHVFVDREEPGSHGGGLFHLMR